MQLLMKLKSSPKFHMAYAVTISLCIFVAALTYDKLSTKAFALVLFALAIVKSLVLGKVNFNMPMFVLLQAMVVISYLSFYTFQTYDTWVVVGVVMSYFCAELTISGVEEKQADFFRMLMCSALALGLFCHGVLMVLITRKEQLLGQMFAVAPFSKEVITAPEAVFNFIIISFMIIWFISIIKKKPYVAIIGILLFVVAQLGIFKLTGSWGGFLYLATYRNRFPAFVYALRQNYIQPQGYWGIPLGGENSSFNMWLDYARDFGLVPCMLLVAFSVLTVVDLVKYIKSTSQLKLLLVPLFVAVNLFYFFEKFARVNVWYFIFGVLIMGLLRSGDKKYE